MYTTFNKPSVNLDELIDLDSLLKLKPLVSLFAAKNMHLAKPLKLKQSSFYQSTSKGIVDYQNEFYKDPTSFENPETIQYLLDNDLFGSYIVFEKEVVYGCKTLYLRYLTGSYYKKHLASECKAQPVDHEFEFFYSWLDKQNIFKEYGRVQIFINEPGSETALHRDYPEETLPTAGESADEFIWITLDKRKQLYIYDEITNEKFYLTGYCNWFNSKALHGADPCMWANYSIKVDGVFSEEFRNKMNGAG